MKYKIAISAVIILGFFGTVFGQSNNTESFPPKESEINNYVVIFSSISALATAASVIVVWRKMSQSNKLTEKTVKASEETNRLFAMELQHRLQPTIEIVNPRVELSDTEINFKAWISNHGKSTAKDFHCGVFHWIQYPYLHKIIEHLDDESDRYYKTFGGGNLESGLGYNADFLIHHDRIKVPYANHWFIHHMTYKFLDNLTAEKITTLHFENDKFIGLDTYDTEQIQKARETYKKHKQNHQEQ